jgi:hypothetical protein
MKPGGGFMLEVFIYALFCFFAAYGFITFLREFSHAALQGKPDKSNGIQLVLLVKNHEHDIEGIVRNMLDFRIKNRLMADCELKVIDLGSSDDTVCILERLKMDYGNIELIRADSSEYEQLWTILQSWVM